MNKIFKKTLLAFIMLNTSLAMADDVSPEYLKIGHRTPWMSNIMMNMRVNNNTGCDNIKLMHNGYVKGEKDKGIPTFVSVPANYGLPATNQLFTDSCKINDNANPTNHPSGENLPCRTFGNDEKDVKKPKSASLVALAKFGGRFEQELSVYDSFFSITNDKGDRAGFYGIIASIVNDNNDAVNNQVSKGNNYIPTIGRNTWTYSIASNAEWPYQNDNIKTSADEEQNGNDKIYGNYGFKNVTLATGYAYTPNIITANPPLCTQNMTTDLGMTINIYPKISIKASTPGSSYEPDDNWNDHDAYLKEMENSQAERSAWDDHPGDNGWKGRLGGFGGSDNKHSHCYQWRASQYGTPYCSDEYNFSLYHTASVFNGQTDYGRTRCKVIWSHDGKDFRDTPGYYARCFFTFQPVTFTVNIDPILTTSGDYQEFVVHGEYNKQTNKCKFELLNQESVTSSLDNTITLKQFTSQNSIVSEKVQLYMEPYSLEHPYGYSFASQSNEVSDFVLPNKESGQTTHPYTQTVGVLFHISTKDAKFNNAPLWVKLTYTCDPSK